MSNHRHRHVQKDHQTEHGSRTDEGGDGSAGDPRRGGEKGERVVGEGVWAEWVEREGRRGGNRRGEERGNSKPHGISEPRPTPPEPVTGIPLPPNASMMLYGLSFLSSPHIRSCPMCDAWMCQHNCSCVCGLALVIEPS
ncbi:hypothetical protein BLNAU_18183 [Blattamonas nauphoetae]|uniref:Uncharacterized protein n=1 Tax=Blattamonas nauphoetae TaxID=2049346 RepID=A0ABQ9X6E0_9EUKA|nr:hypothetical protein BLNAU_18183 [Blattamonas nauphoetae]